MLLWASIVLNLALLWALVWGGQGLMAYKTLRRELDALAARSEALNKENIRLSREIKLLESDDKYIEQMLRKRLNFIKENEIWYIFPKDRGVEGADETEN